MASQTAGITQLLQAERKAAEKVNEARKRKAKRLKQAKEEAQQEIGVYKQVRITLLLQAERKAAEKVNEARKRKAKRLKQAKEEAQQEIGVYKQERERQFKDFEAKHLGSRGDAQARIEAETQTELNNMNRLVAQNKEKVINQLLQSVCDVQPKVHRNLRVNPGA